MQNKLSLKNKVRFVVVVLWLSLALSVYLPNADAHKFHASMAQIDYNAKTQSVECVIRFFADDFQTALSQHSKRTIKLDSEASFKDKANGAAVLAYVRERFELKTKGNLPVKFNWVGMEGMGDMIWVYVEGKCPGGLTGAQLRDRVMMELFDDQVNVVNFKFDGKQTGTMFNLQDGFKAVPDKK